MPEIRIQIDTKDVERTLGAFKDAMPTVIKNGINNALVQIQEAQYGHMRDKFTIRKESFMKRSVKIKFATPQKLEGSVYIAPMPGQTESVFTKFEEGTTKRRTGGQVAIPTAVVRPNNTQLISAGKRPRNLHNAFKTTIHGQNYIAVKNKAKNAVMQIAYVLRDSVRTPRILDFQTTARQTMNKILNATMTTAINRAIEKANR